MSLFLPIRWRHRLPGHLAAAVAGAALVLIAVRARAQSPPIAAEQRTESRLAWSEGASPPAGLAGRIDDVVLGPGGILNGRVLRGEERAHRAAAPGLPVALVRSAQTIATTVTDARGRFTFRGLRGGVYGVVISTGDGPVWRWYRLWTNEARPPHASNHVNVLVGRPLFRGQSPFPIRRLPRAATVAAIAAGAIVPPIIYHGVKRDEHIPASP